MISPHHLTVVMWTVVLAWVGTTVLVLAEFEIRARRSARISVLLARLTSTDRTSRGAPASLSLLQFQALVRAGLPRRVETALADQVRSHEGDEQLFALADGSRPGTIEERIQALQVLASGHHPRSYAALAAGLRAPQREVAAMSLRLLKRLDDEGAVEVLAGALAAGAYSASRIAAALDRMTAERTACLGPLLRHDSQTVRFWALLLIGRAGVASWANDVRRLMIDSSPHVRRAAVEALGRLADPVDQVVVLTALADPIAMVRVHAARAAASFPTVTMAGGVTRLLADREWIVRAAARDSLCRMGAVATDAVISTLWEGDPFAANNAAEVLFVTGATSTLVLHLLEQPQNGQLRRLVDQVMTASGPQIGRAIYDQLESHQQLELNRILTGAPIATIRRE